MKKSKTKQSTLVLAIVVAMMLIISCTGALAFLTGTDSIENEWKIGYVDVELDENFRAPDELEPGLSFTKDVKAVNNGPNDAYVRIKVIFSDGDMEKASKLDYNTTDFELNNDGYWYYKKILQSGEKTESLFTTVTISEDVEKEDLKDFDIQVYLEAYQSEGFDNYKAAWEHFHTNK